MKSHIAAALLSFALAGGAQAASPDAAITKTVMTFADTFNRGDIKGAAATHNPAGTVIIDDVAPFIWRGRSAFADWMRDLGAYDQKAGITDEHVVFLPPTRIEHDATRAYAVVPTVYTYRQHGTAMRSRAQITLALEKGPAGWLIDGWTWTGPRETPVK